MSIVNIIKTIFTLLGAPIIASICVIVLIVHVLLILVLLIAEEIIGLARR
tara:strand:- start:44 stop:193 length:150 start_codon:yes stop_codon:yes gene_type:complete